MSATETAGTGTRSARIWFWVTIVFIVASAGLTAYVALRTEDQLKARMEGELRDLHAAYAEARRVLGKPPAHPEELLRLLAQSNPPRPATEEAIRNLKAKVAWGLGANDDVESQDRVLAYFNDAPVRGRRAIVTLGGEIKWLTVSEFKTATSSLHLE